MTPEAQRSLEKADTCLMTARAELAIKLGSEAGRNAYLAAFHAARAFIFERTGKVIKRHESVHREFHRLAKEETAIDKGILPFLSQGYNMKAIATTTRRPVLSSPPKRRRPQLKQQPILLSASEMFLRRGTVLACNSARTTWMPM